MKNAVRDLKRAALCGLACGVLYILWGGIPWMTDTKVGPTAMGLFHFVNEKGMLLSTPDGTIVSIVYAVNAVVLMLMVGGRLPQAFAVVAPYRMTREKERARWISSEIVSIAMYCAVYWCAYALSYTIVLACMFGGKAPLTGLGSLIYTWVVRLVPGSVVICLCCNMLAHRLNQRTAVMILLAVLCVLIHLTPRPGMLLENVRITYLNPMVAVSAAWESMMVEAFPGVNIRVALAIYWAILLAAVIGCTMRHFKRCDIL